jgi:hypothetical protein
VVGRNAAEVRQKFKPQRCCRPSRGQRHREVTGPTAALLARRTTKVAAVALANKTARIIWAIMTNGERYREPVGQAA